MPIDFKVVFPKFKGDWKHLEILLEGVEIWNEWRQQNPDIEPHLLCLDISRRRELPPGQIWNYIEKLDLYEADLKHANLRDARLKLANLQGANLEQANLRGAHLEHADLRMTRLRQAYLPFSHLENAKLMDSDLGQADLECAHLEHANLQGAKLGGDFRGAHLEHAQLQGALLRGANFEEAHLGYADFRLANLKQANLLGAHIKHAELLGADFSKADLRVAKPQHLRFDETRIHRARFSPGSADPWSVVRVSYSGPALLFHLLFLIAFLVPYLGRATYWKGVNAAQEALQYTQVEAAPLLERATTTLEKLAESPTAREEFNNLWQEHGLDPKLLPEGRQVLDQTLLRQRDLLRDTLSVRTLKPLLEIGPCLRPAAECGPPQPILYPLFGLHRRDDPLRLLALVLVFYNLIRGVVTWWVSRLRDAGERGGYTPRLIEYIWVYYIHRWFLQFVPWAAGTAALFRVTEWLLLTEVVLPRA